MRMKWILPGTTQKVIIPASSWSPTNSENVLVSYWESTDWTSLPDAGLDSLEDPPYSTEYVSHVDFEVAEDKEFLGSGLSENVFARFEGFLNFEVDGKYELCIHSDDASVLYFDYEEKLIVSMIHSQIFNHKCIFEYQH